MDPTLVLFGFAVGALVGLTGMGGGSLMTPLLIIVFGVNPVTAVGTDLAYAAVTKTVGGYKHLRQQTVDTSLSAWMAIGSVPSAVGGVYVLKALRHAYGKSFDHVMLILVAAALLVSGAAVLLRAVLLPRLAARERERALLDPRTKLAAVALGVSVGFVLGMTSAGSGALIAVGLILIFRLSPRRVVGTDVFHAAILLWAASVAHIAAGNVDFGMAGTILIGSIPGVWIGSKLVLRVPIASLRAVLAIVLVGSGLGLLSKAGVSVPTAVLAGVPLTVAVVLAGEALRRRTDAGRAADAARAATVALGVPPAGR